MAACEDVKGYTALGPWSRGANTPTDSKTPTKRDVPPDAL